MEKYPVYQKQDRWVHGFDDWVWDDKLSCWYHETKHGHDYWCLGDRMFHEAYGRSPGQKRYHGSYTDDWHGGIQTSSFKEAITWLHRAIGTGCELW